MNFLKTLLNYHPQSEVNDLYERLINENTRKQLRIEELENQVEWLQDQLKLAREALFN